MIPGSPDAALRVTGLSKRFGRLSVLENVSLTALKGEVLGLIGPNGSGKTTLFECLGGVLPRDAGSIEWTGGALSNGFYLPDGISPWAHETVDWAQRFVLGLFNGPAALRDRINCRLGLDHLLHQRLATLSKGQRKRALLAIGLLTPQPVLLADEPFDGLDLRQARDAAALLREVASTGRTLVLSIHQIAEASLVCDRFLLLSGGRVCGEGTLTDLCRRAGVANGTPLEEVFLALT